MDLDDRASRAAADLRRQVDRDLDVSAARASFDGAARHRLARVARTRGATAAIAVLAVVAAFAFAGTRGGDGGLQTDGGPSDQASAKEADKAAAILNALPRGAIDGKASWRLPVVVKPQTGLKDGQTVTVYGRGFGARESLGIVQCSSEADTGAAGVAGCQLASTGATGGFGAVTYATSSNEGTVVAEFVLHRFITTPGGKIDCLSAAERCLVGVGAVSNYDKSGGAYVDFAGAPEFATPHLTVDPAGPYTVGQPVKAHVSGWVPLRAVRMQQCIGDRCENLTDGKADAQGNADLSLILQPTVIDPADGREVPCAGRCVIRATGVGVEGGSSAPFPDDVPIDFEPVSTGAPTTAPPSTTGPETTAPPEATTTSIAPATSGPPTTAPPASTTSTTAPGATFEPD